jgi:hypothetical protein
MNILENIELSDSSHECWQFEPPFPLTPPLSPEERENARPPSEQPETPGPLQACRIVPRRNSEFPLPGGEGQGEGKRDVTNPNAQTSRTVTDTARIFFVLFALMVAVVSSAIAQPLENILYSAGTTIADPQNRQWSYVLWQSSTPDLLKERSFGIYRKSGDASSANLYERKAIARLTMDPGTIAVLINRAVNLGENPALLEEHVTTLFQKLMPPHSSTLADKLSIVIRSSLDTTEHFRNLILLSRVHPAVTLCLGLGYADQIAPAGQFTYEIRQFDAAKQQDIAVVGRVTVQAGVPTILPAPGAPVQVLDIPATSAKGDLNAKFRWATPDALRRLSLMGYGFNLYRVTTNYAWPHNFHNVPPGLGVLDQLAKQFENNPSNPPVKLVNKAPVLKSKDFDALNVANFNTNSPGGDATTYFIHDDNDRYKPNGVPFKNGEKFYYFVTARDVLGRDGFTSPGSLVMMCDRLPPDAPRGVAVENDYSKQPNQAPQQVLKVSWKQNTNTASETHKFYYVYRWTNHSDSLKDTLPPLGHPNLIGAPIPQTPGLDRLSMLDNGFGSPHMPEDAGKTFWYTVRVVDDSACGGNFSAHTGPAFGVLRDRVGPNAPTGLVAIVCCEPTVMPDKTQDFAYPNSDANRAYFRPACDRFSPAIEWAEFYAFDTAKSNLIHRLYFAGSNNRVSTDVSWPRPLLVNTQVTFYCRVGTTAGKVSPFTSTRATPTTVGAIRQVGFKGDLDCNRALVGSTANERCNRHEPIPPGGGTNNCVDMFLALAADTKEVKIYKRVDFGPLTLIEQSKTTNSIFQFSDCTPIANPGNVCYFVQAFDEHGNASAMVPIGSCIDVGGATKIAKPILSPLSPSGTAAGPLMDVTWFCPPYGIDRFEVSIAIEGDATAPAQISTVLSDQARIDSDVDFKTEGKQRKDDFAVYQTHAVGPGFGEGAKFRVTVSIELGKTYYVFVRAIGKDGTLSDHSNAEEFNWSEPQLAGPLVPWPDRPLPALQAVFDPGIIATNLPTDAYPVGIRIGSKVPIVGNPTNGNAMIQSFTTPLNYLYARKDGSTVLPLALYRYQVPNANFPTVSGDITQVSPLMEKIAFQQTNVAPFGQVTIIRDRFIGVYRIASATGAGGYDMFLLDTQPVITGARYGYLLVRFGDNREIEEVIPTNEVEL